MSKWTVADMPDLSDKMMVVTGANSGLGYESSLALATKKATVVMACRNMEKGEAAKATILAEVPNASLEVMALDLSSQQSIRDFATAFHDKYDQLDVLLNNAGVMALPRRETADGFEMQFGTNHLGHFALTGLLLDRLLATPKSRIVTVSSGLHERGAVNFDDLHGRQSYDKWKAYSQSKLANLLFAFELQRKLTTIGSQTISVGTHPGYAATNLQQAGPNMEGSFLMKWVMRLANRFVAQSAEMGALSQLYAAVADDVQGGDYIGPNGMKGYPQKVDSSPASKSKEDATRLWAISEDLTGIEYTALLARNQVEG